MKKKTDLRKISLSVETIRELTTKQFHLVHGGAISIPSETTGCKTCG
jgi:hypothetical protein